MHLSLRLSLEDQIKGLVSHLDSFSHTQTLLLSPNCCDIFIHLEKFNEMPCPICSYLEGAKVSVCEKMRM